MSFHGNTLTLEFNSLREIESIAMSYDLSQWSVLRLDDGWSMSFPMNELVRELYAEEILAHNAALELDNTVDNDDNDPTIA